MSDKEFDKVVQDRFADFEAEPSASVWGSIEDRLKNNKRKTFPVFWMAAASVIILTAAGLYFFRPKHKVWLQGTEIVQDLKPAKPEAPDTASLQIPIPVNQEGRIAAKPLPVKIKRPVKAVVMPEPEAKDPETILTVNKAADPVITQESNVPGKTPAVAIAEQADPEKALNIADETSEPAFSYQEIKRIKLPSMRSVGDFVNFVVGKVDQREDKIIEFKESDEGSEVSAINLGPLKYKSKKYK